MMAEYIESTKMADVIHRYFVGYKVEDMIQDIRKEAVANVAPVVHGRWIQEYRIEEMCYSPDDIERYKVPDGFSCSICSKWNSAKTNYCPNCGARMDGE